MNKKFWQTSCGAIYYWISRTIQKEELTLVFLPGLTADHRLFDKQLEYFKKNTIFLYGMPPGHGFQMLAEAMEHDLPYRILCPALLIYGEKDLAGSCIYCNKAWNRDTGIPLKWIKEAGHNSNTDQPEIVNILMKEFIDKEVKNN